MKRIILGLALVLALGPAALACDHAVAQFSAGPCAQCVAQARASYSAAFAGPVQPAPADPVCDPAPSFNVAAGAAYSSFSAVQSPPVVQVRRAIVPAYTVTQFNLPSASYGHSFGLATVPSYNVGFGAGFATGHHGFNAAAVQRHQFNAAAVHHGFAVPRRVRQFNLQVGGGHGFSAGFRSGPGY